jgi:negative regulator of flagellin synthesis FlgM
MNVNPVKFEKIESMYQNKKQEQAKNMNLENQDKVEISDLGKYLSKVSSEEEEILTERIKSIKQRIEDGTYKIDSNDLAKKIIEKMKE